MGPGLLALAPAVIGAAGGVASSVIGGSAASGATRDTNATNLALARETNEQNYKIFQESKDFSREQADTQWEREKEMFNMENSYNNPVEVVGRLREAGLNPALAMQGSLGSAMSSAASGGQPQIGASPSAPTMVAPQMQNPAPYYNNIATGISDSLFKASQIAKNISEAKKTGVETRKLEAMLDIDIERGELDNEYQRLQNHFERYYGDIKRTRENELLWQQIQKVVQDQFATAAQGQLSLVEAKKAQQEIKEITERMNLTREQRKLLEKENSVFFQNFNKEMAVKSSQIKANIASAEDSQASAEEHRSGSALKRSQKEGQDISNTWIDDEKSASVAESESRTFKNNMDASTPHNYIEAGSKGVNSSKAYGLSRKRRQDIRDDHDVRYPKKKKRR